MLVVSSMVCLWLYPVDVFLSVSFAWACHAVYLCEAMWLPEHLLLVLPFAHILCFLVICCLMACASRAARASSPRAERRPGGGAPGGSSARAARYDLSGERGAAEVGRGAEGADVASPRYRDRSQRRFKDACDRAKLFQEDPQAFFREKKYRGGGAAAPARVDIPDV